MRFLSLLFFSCSFWGITRAQMSTPIINVKLESSYNIVDKKTIMKAQTNLSLLFTRINQAYNNNSPIVDFTSILIDNYAKEAINEVYWKRAHFKVRDNVINKGIDAFNNQQFFEVNQIPFIIDNPNRDYEEVKIALDSYGKILCFDFLKDKLFFESMTTGTNFTDEDNQWLVWYWMEKFRTAYTKKNLSLIEDFYSDDAIIITSRVRYKKDRQDNERIIKVVDYVKSNKPAYINKLKPIMTNPNRKIAIEFSSIENPNMLNHNISKSRFVTKRHGINSRGDSCTYFGVRVRQKWTTLDNRGDSIYSDTGYLFLLWEFPQRKYNALINQNDERYQPKIHVRTWQPEIGTDFDSIFSITDFQKTLKMEQ